MVFIPSGSFVSGPPDFTQKRTLNGFYIDRYEVTQQAFETVMKDNPSFFKGPNRPVEKVTWYDADAYCRKVGKRLPSEWEWEKAARAGTDTFFYWGEKFQNNFGWSRVNADKQTHPVGSKTPNAYGLFDTAGNVWEWTSSDHENGGKVMRGGSWRNGPKSQSPSHRVGILPNQWFHYVGIRCASSRQTKPKK